MLASVSKTHKLTIFSMFLSMGIALSFIEIIYFPPLAIPGAKIGLSSIVTLIMLLFFSPKDILLNVVLRITAASFLTGTFLSTIYIFSLLAGIGSTILMLIFFELFHKEHGKLHFLRVFSLIGISIIGGVSHNIIQIIIASIILSTSFVWVHLPLLLLTGTIAGFFNGYICNYIAGRNDLRRYISSI